MTSPRPDPHAMIRPPPPPEEVSGMSELHDLVDPSAVRLDVAATDWREAIRASGDLLVDTGAIGTSYVEAMVRTVEEHGPYIVITPGFALAHRSEEHTSELQSLGHLVCRLLLEKK